MLFSRSPYIMRFEKPPMPAPPEYTRESMATATKKASTVAASTHMNSAGGDGGDESVLNELRSMLSRDLDTMAADCGFGGADDALNKSSPSSSASPAVLDSDDNVHLLANHHHHRSSYSKPPPLQPAASHARQNLVNEIFMANARLKQQLSQLNQITDIDLSNKHQLQKLLP